MKKSNRLFLLFLMTVLLFSMTVTPMSATVHAETKAPAEYVDPLIGTDVYAEGGAMGEANVFPGATTPHGMVQLSPDTGRHIAGYLYSDNNIEGFSFTHFSGTGSWGFGNFLSTATTGELKTTENTYKSKFSHDEETASAGYYSVLLQDYDIQAELTATTRVGFLRYTFPESDTGRILFDASHTLEDEPVSDATIQVIDNETVVGSQTNPSPFHHGPTPYKIYFAAKFSQPFDSYGTWNGSNVKNGSPSESGRDVGAFLNYNTDQGEQVLVKVGISYVSTDNALANIEAEVPGWDFEQVKEQVRNTWNERLSRIEVSGGSEEDKVKFYSSLYRALLGPYTFSDANGEYIGFDHKIHKAEGYTQYHTFSLWDTFRHAHPLYTLIEPKVQNDAVKSLLADYEQGGWLPRWPMANVYTNDMISDHASSVIAETIMKGIRDFDVEKAYEAMVHNATETPQPGDDAWGRANLPEYIELGYIPHELNSQSVSWTVENAYVDFAISQVAKSLGKEADYETFMKRAKSFKNVFDPETRWMRPRHEDGSWKTPFDPGDWAGFTEGNAWTYSWFVPHDVRGLTQLMGEETLINRLDHFFEEFVYPAYNEKISHYWHGNEPDQHAPFLYNYVGQPWKTQEITQRIVNELYGTGPNGIPGNEDMGQLSAWFVFSAMGISPVAPVTGEYQITSPIFDKVIIHLPEYHYGGKDFVIEAAGYDGHMRYIASAELNEEPLNKAWITHQTLSQGGKLKLAMDAKPNKQWATDPEAAPSSMTTEKPQLRYDSFELAKQEVEANEPLELTATVTNVGGLGMAKAEIYVDGKAYDAHEVMLDEGETKQITLTTRLNEAGEHRVSVGKLPAQSVIVHPKPAEFTAYMKTLARQLAEEGEFTNHSAAHLLQVHLASVERFVEKGAAEKVAKHMDGFKLLLDHQKENGLISEYGYHILKVEADYFAERWPYVGVAKFKTSDLSFNAVEPGEDAKISVIVSNVGLASGDEKVEFYFDGTLVETKTIALKPSESQTVTFVAKNVAVGLHQVRINNLTGTLKALYDGKPVLSLHLDQDSGATVIDSSPYGLDGTVHGDATWETGKFGKALKFNGGRVEVPHNTLLDGGDELTLSVWVNLSDPETNQKIIGKSSIGNGYILGVENGKLYPELWDVNGTHYTFRSGSIPKDEWTHLALTWQSNGRLIGYVNGEEVENIAASTTLIGSNENPLIIGGAPWDPGAFKVKGMVDELRIFKRALSAEEIQQLYQANEK